MIKTWIVWRVQDNGVAFSCTFKMVINALFINFCQCCCCWNCCLISSQYCCSWQCINWCWIDKLCLHLIYPQVNILLLMQNHKIHHSYWCCLNHHLIQPIMAIETDEWMANLSLLSYLPSVHCASLSIFSIFTEPTFFFMIITFITRSIIFISYIKLNESNIYNFLWIQR